MIKELIKQLLCKKDLTSLQMQQAMEEILTNAADISDVVTFLTALNDKGETVEELISAVNVMRQYVEPISVDKPNILDTCGTGGDNLGTFNISTLAALVASGAGITVAKHGNRSVSSKCGSADILEALGVKINMDKEQIRRCLDEIGIAFLFAPNLHLAMRQVAPARKQIAQKTIFNILGPLINPAQARHQLIGVFSKTWVRPLAEVLHNLGSKHILVVHGADGLDEITTTDRTFITEVKDGSINDYEIVPEDFGFKRASLDDLIGGSIDENVRITQQVLAGQLGSRRDIVLFNAGAAIYAADKAKTIKEGIKLAEESIDSKAAWGKLQQLREYQ